jgi:hypothetical protein
VCWIKGYPGLYNLPVSSFINGQQQCTKCEPRAQPDTPNRVRHAVSSDGAACRECGKAETKEEKLLWCGRCNAVCYCSVACQVGGWVEAIGSCGVRYESCGLCENGGQ